MGPQRGEGALCYENTASDHSLYSREGGAQGGNPSTKPCKQCKELNKAKRPWGRTGGGSPSDIKNPWESLGNMFGAPLGY